MSKYAWLQIESRCDQSQLVITECTNFNIIFLLDLFYFILFFKCFAFMYECAQYITIWMLSCTICVQYFQGQEDAVRVSEAGVKDGCKSHMSDGNQIQVLCNCSKCSQPEPSVQLFLLIQLRTNSNILAQTFSLSSTVVCQSFYLIQEFQL